MLSGRLATLDELRRADASGTPANAAVLYRQAAKELRGLDSLVEDRVEFIRAMGDGVTPDTPETRKAIGIVMRAADLVDRGAAIDYCSFRGAADQLEPAPDYVPALYQLTLLGVARAEKAIGRRDLQPVVLAIDRCVRVQFHLAEDGQLLSAFAAHKLAARCAALVALYRESAAGDSPMPDASLLASLLAKFSPGDPFGYESAHLRTARYVASGITRDEATEDLAEQSPAGQKRVRARYDHVLDVVRARDDDELLVLSIATEQTEQGGPASEEGLRGWNLYSTTLALPREASLVDSPNVAMLHRLTDGGLLGHLCATERRARLDMRALRRECDRLEATAAR